MISWVVRLLLLLLLTNKVGRNGSLAADIYINIYFEYSFNIDGGRRYCGTGVVNL
jgi:hypothetical protein